MNQETADLMQELTENGCREFDRMQTNLSLTASMTDAELIASPCAMDALFEQPPATPEERRAEARRTQDKLDRKGRAAFAHEYAEAQAKNYGA